jgi:hypothetical protein
MMNKETEGQTEKASQQGGEEHAKTEPTTKEKWDASWERVALGVAAAAGTGLLAATWIGVGPAALAGAAGYLAYHGLRGKRKAATADVQH